LILLGAARHELKPLWDCRNCSAKEQILKRCPLTGIEPADESLWRIGAAEVFSCPGGIDDPDVLEALRARFEKRPEVMENLPARVASLIQVIDFTTDT
jgi:hypothetical protein